MRKVKDKNTKEIEENNKNLPFLFSNKKVGRDWGLYILELIDFSPPIFH